MKKALFLFFFCAVAASTSLAQEQKQEPSANATTIELAKEKKIEISDVPANVVSALNRTAYKSEKVSEVYELTSSDEKHYKFVVDDGREMRDVVFNEAGTMQSDRKHQEQ